eukprot:1433521-Amphidinium_carterae.1
MATCTCGIELVFVISGSGIHQEERAKSCGKATGCTRQWWQWLGDAGCTLWRHQCKFGLPFMPIKLNVELAAVPLLQAKPRGN